MRENFQWVPAATLQQQTADCLALVGQGGLEGGGSIGKVRGEGWGPLTLTHPLSPDHLLGFHNGCEGECGCEEGRWRVAGLAGGCLHSVTLQPCTLQSHAGPGRGRPGHRRLQALCRSEREIYGPSDPTQMTLHFPNTHSGLLLILLRSAKLFKVINNKKHY